MNVAAPEPIVPRLTNSAVNSRSKRRVLVVDDDSTTCQVIATTLEGPELEVTWRTSGEEAIELATNDNFDVILTDIAMPAMDGIEVCRRIVAEKPDVPVVVVTGNASIESAIAALQAGAYDFVIKPVDAKLLTVTVARALERRRLQSEVKQLRRVVVGVQRFGPMIGTSAAMNHVFDLITRVAESNASVLITGESGTGKELVARAIHDHSTRSSGPFLALNCAAVPAALLESELFGHTRGAFTDAKNARTGLFAQTSGGTLFLDEIGELPIEMQPKLLRALQERKVRPVGGNVEIPFDTRIITATNRDLDVEVLEKRFREDLYYRINVVRIDAPPLREREGDVLLLAQYFVDKFSARCGQVVRGITLQAAEKLVAYNWPGNVRELENCLERAIALLRGDEVTVDDLPEKISQYREAPRDIPPSENITEVVTLDEHERRYVLHVLAMVGDNKTRAADLLGLDRRTLYRRIERYEQDRLRARQG